MSGLEYETILKQVVLCFLRTPCLGVPAEKVTWVTLTVSEVFYFQEGLPKTVLFFRPYLIFPPGLKLSFVFRSEV